MIPQMKAAVRKHYGAPDQIKIASINKPIPKADEVLVKIHATTVNRTDCANLTAKPFIMRLFLGLFGPKKTILGTDFAGEVMETGKNITLFNKGDKVMGFNDMGTQSQAEYSCIKAKDLFLMPENISYKQATASLEGAHYAYSFIHKVTIAPGQKVLINGASGGIGSALLQFVRQYEATIAATCNTKNIELIKSLGADKVYDYTKEDFTVDTKNKYDFIFDAVGKSTFGKCKPILAENGIYISSELGPYAQNAFLPIFNSLSKKKVIFPIPYPTQKSIPYIIDLLKQGKFDPLIDREYSLADISKAYDFVLTGQKTGNVIVNL
jgi:NADPH:quinone reductase-like Zn-dependent oxidoreductase